MPTISVVVPAYNAERTILEAIASVQQQTFSDFELIVIDDGSNDRTLELLHSVTDERIRIFSYENGGVCVARNHGISHATGEFIAFLDADDLWTPDKLALQLAALQQHPEAGAAYSWTYFMNEKGGNLFYNACEPIFFNGNVYANLLVGDFIYTASNPLLRKQAIEFVGDFDPALKSCEDWDYWLRIAARWPFIVVPKYQIFYRQSSGSLSSKVEVMKSASLLALEKAYRAAPPELQSLKNQSFISFHIYCASLYLKHSTDMSGVNEAGRNLWIAIRLQPQILLNKYNQTLVIKFLLKRVLSPGIASHLLQLISKLRASRNLRFQQ